MQQSDDSSGNMVKWIVILAAVAGIGLCVLGVFAAIAIPAFIKYIKRSKASEAQGVTSRVADEVRMQYSESCSLPPELPPSYAVDSSCCGGVKCMTDEAAAAKWKEAGLTAPQDPTYFSYSTQRTSDGAYEVIAQTDFTCGGPRHSYTVTLVPQKTGGDCSLEMSPGVVTNEFE